MIYKLYSHSLTFSYHCTVKLFPKIRLKLGRRSLRKKAAVSNRRKMVHNFTTAKSAGILYDATQTDSFNQVNEFRNFLSALNIKTTVLGYVNSDEIPGELILRDNCHFFGNKDIDYFFRPKNSQSISFIDEKFSILFDLSSTALFPIEYLSTLSIADFKVARFTEAQNDHDFMINTGTDDSLEYLIIQIKHYVSLLNNSSQVINKSN
jgi:hypothetical protein